MRRKWTFIWSQIGMNLVSLTFRISETDFFDRSRAPDLAGRLYSTTQAPLSYWKGDIPFPFSFRSASSALQSTVGLPSLFVLQIKPL